MRGATVRFFIDDKDKAISIHAPHARSDRSFPRNALISSSISIHAPHARSDQNQAHLHHLQSYFNPRSSCEERPSPVRSHVSLIRFQSTLLMRGATKGRELADDFIVQFQSTLLMRGATRVTRQSSRTRRYFNPRSSCEERPLLSFISAWRQGISIHAPHARSDLGEADELVKVNISIHAPHARSDRFFCMTALFCASISIHAPHARSDLLRLIVRRRSPRFQSTLLMRGATLSMTFGCSITFYFNPRSSCEERPAYQRENTQIKHISIHAPHARSDHHRRTYFSQSVAFQSTLLMRGATIMALYLLDLSIISIHAPHARSDRDATPCQRPVACISIHAPHARSDLYQF